MTINRYAFWNNKGGTGKTSLAFQSICHYAAKNPEESILAIDVCPQGNLSELFLGGMEGGGADSLYQLQSKDKNIRQTIGGYFETRLTSPYNPIKGLNTKPFICRPCEKNSSIPRNIDLLAGDPVLELQSNAMSSLANQQIPGIKAWLNIVDWLNDFINHTNNTYTTIFFDLNPSFSMYTQIALAASSRIIIPIMADESSKRAILNAFALMYSLSLPSDIYKSHAFGERLREDKRELPRVHLVIKNRITRYMGEASAYGSVLKAITGEIDELRVGHPDCFTNGFSDENYIAVGDFNTAGVVAFARGLPFLAMEEKGKHYTLGKRRIQVALEQRNNRVKDINNVADRL